MANINEHDWHLVGREHIHASKYRVDVEDARARGDDGELVNDCTYMRSHLEVVATGERIWTSAVYPSADYTPSNKLPNAKRYGDMLVLADREATGVETSTHA
jgi:hypothetical protein